MTQLKKIIARWVLQGISLLGMLMGFSFALVFITTVLFMPTSFEGQPSNYKLRFARRAGGVIPEGIPGDIILISGELKGPGTFMD